ncbi:vWA domain-containing protein [Paenibacillus sp. IHBB 10380]|uniref:vWA domain-containing protein n=1 Tax=Paenibacillus sp. IHBB 10380 TaxID=1566358 RepID=UPI0005CFBF0D|nr:vWA domain-containing protein [Paenibacillus sp. IHBB 10380]AJS60967.1 von Willebrand factor A [Paenibacillus sp. IHBB 10380]
MQRKINLLLLLFSLIGGAIGFVIGELLLSNLYEDWPGMVVIGLYFGILAFFIGLFCLIAEMINPRLSGPSWRQRYMGASWKWLVPATLVAVFGLGLLFEFLYQINPGSVKSVQNIVLVIDNSGSMSETDPNDGRYTAAKSLVDKMDSKKQVAVVEFSDEAKLVQPFIQLKNQANKDEVYGTIDSLVTSDGGTNFKLALQESLKHIEEQQDPGRGTMVILLSDGFSEMDLSNDLAGYQQHNIVINTIGLSVVNGAGSGLLNEIALRTGGKYYDVTNADEISTIYQTIYNNIGDRTLVTERTGPTQDSTYYMVFRIVALTLIGLAIGLSLGLIFDNRYFARSFGTGGAVAGVLAGLLLEFGLSGQSPSDSITRLLACLILAGVIAIFTFIIPVKENGRIQEGGQRPGRAGVNSGRGLSGRDQGSSKGF